MKSPSALPRRPAQCAFTAVTLFPEQQSAAPLTITHTQTNTHAHAQQTAAFHTTLQTTHTRAGHAWTHNIVCSYAIIISLFLISWLLGNSFEWGRSVGWCGPAPLILLEYDSPLCYSSLSSPQKETLPHVKMWPRFHPFPATAGFSVHSPPFLLFLHSDSVQSFHFMLPAKAAVK